VVNIRQKKKQRERYLCKIGGDVYKRTGSELAVMIGEEEFNRIMKECRDERNWIGPFNSAAEAIRSMLEDDDDEDEDEI
jgi:hypothetical protein